uniref:Uncharacterized protein n=1 Tax=Mola mola TaxID=94237 RepID=A0A3Q4B393_MOLML
MATSVQTLPLSRGPNKNFRNTFPAPPLSSRCVMGSVGSLVERPDVSPTKTSRAVPQVRPKQTNGLLKKGFTQRELLNYLNITRKEPKTNLSSVSKKEVISGTSTAANRKEDNLYAKIYHKDGTEVDLTKNSLPSGSKYEKVNIAVSSVRATSQEDDNLSDSGHNSMTSLPPYRPPFHPHLAHISASMGHINTIGSLDRTSLSPKAVGSGGAAIGEVSCQSMATLSRLAPYGGEAPPPYEWTLSLSVEEKEHELKQMRRNLDESEGVFEGKQRLWEKELEELKRLYAAKLRQVSQHAQRSQRGLQLQLFKAQQEKSQLQEELDRLKRERSQEPAKPTSPTLEETQWEVCQKSGEISLLKQQLRDSQVEVTQKLSELFQLKTQLRETRTELRNQEGQIDALKLVLHVNLFVAGGCGGSTEERLRAELLLERRQSEAQALAFEEERQTWQMEKDKVIRYQKELQASYVEMYHHNEALERELHQLRAGGRSLFSQEISMETIKQKPRACQEYRGTA